MGPEIKISTVANLWCKQMFFKSAGDTMQGHRHLFDHQTLLAYGKFTVTKDDKIYENVSAPHILFIEAGSVHEIKAEVAGSVAYCIHPIREGERVEDIVDPEMLPPFGGKLKQPLAE